MYYAYTHRQDHVCLLIRETSTKQKFIYFSCKLEIGSQHGYSHSTVKRNQSFFFLQYHLIHGLYPQGPRQLLKLLSPCLDLDIRKKEERRTSWQSQYPLKNLPRRPTQYFHLRHRATPSCKGHWEMYFFPLGALPPQIKLVLCY